MNLRIVSLLVCSALLDSCGGGGGASSTGTSTTAAGPAGESSGGSATPASIAACTSGTPTSGFSATGLTGDTGSNYPSCSEHFGVSEGKVVGSGSTAAGASDHFYGQYGVEYTVTVNAGAQLISLFDNSSESGNPAEPPLETSANTPEGEVIAFSYGTLVNNGSLNTYPLLRADAANNYKKGAAVVYIADDNAHASSILNNGSIGDIGVSSTSNAHYDYGQEDSDGVYMQGGTIVNGSTGSISGYNAVFTRNNGTLDNYGMIVGVNDGALSGYVITNHLNAGLSTNNAGFACAHSYSTLTNYGYMLGNDYCVLAEGSGSVINDYGGPVVPGVKNFDGSPVYNGEISSLIRGSETPNLNGPFNTSDAIMLDGTNQVVNLYTTTIEGVVYLPYIGGPMEGGFNGSFASSTQSGNNTLNLHLDGIPLAEAQALQAAITASMKTNANGTYYSGSFTMSNGFVYQWEDFAHVAFTGTPQ